MKKFILLALLCLSSCMITCPAYAVDVTQVVGPENVLGGAAETDPIALPVINNHTGLDAHDGVFAIVSTSGDISAGNHLIVKKHIVFAGTTSIFSRYSAVNDQSLIFAHASTTAFTVDLHPLANSRVGEAIRIIKDDDTFNTLTVDPSGSETIGGDATLIMETPGDAITIVKIDATDWRIVQKAVTGTANITWNTETGRVKTTGGSPYYTSGGYYHWDATDADVTQASPTATHGAANEASFSHAGAVFGFYSDAGGAGSAFLDVSGIAYNDDGTSAANVETIIPDLSVVSLDEHFESTVKYDGVVTYIIKCSGGCTQTTYESSFNFGHSKYQDFGNRDFTLRSIRVGPHLADANDSGFNICVKKHSSSGWTYAATGFTPGNGDIACMLTDRPSAVLVSGLYFSWDHELTVPMLINGADSEGLITELTNGTNNSATQVIVKYGGNFQ